MRIAATVMAIQGRTSISLGTSILKMKAGSAPSNGWNGRSSAGSTVRACRKSPVTLFELIIELKNLEKEERRRRRLPPQMIT